MVGKGIDREMARQAFMERNREIQLRRMRQDLPGLLPPEDRPEFLDPDWDHCDDPVPCWVTLVHIAFMGWTIISAPNPAGLSILKSYFDEEVSPGGIFLAAAFPTAVLWLTFLVF